MFNSIRWTLLFWYGLILVLVIVGFGATLYFSLEHETRTERDTRLREWAQTVARGFDDRRWEGIKLVLPPTYARALQTSDPEGPYYIVWNAAGRVAARSPANLEIAFPEAFRVPAPPKRPPRPQASAAVKDEEVGPHPQNGRPRPTQSRRPWGIRGHVPPPEQESLKTPLSRDRGPCREMIVRGPQGSTVLVGRSNEEDRRRLRVFLMRMLGASAGALALAMVGGWFLAEWALAPIARMSDAASSISASNLSRRIDMAQTESELGRLATILNETFDRLEGAFVRQVQFTADASHELRTPLSVVISHCELALRKPRTPEEYREMFATALKAAKRMRGVIEGLLTLARADSTAPNLDHEPVDLAEIVEESVEMLRPLAATSKVELEVEAEPAETLGDHDRLRELVVNLVSNAVRYNREDGRVTVRLRKDPDGLTLTVADTGIGIPEQHWPELFERFYRVDPVRSRELGGSGLGLAIARWIVEAHGGTITFTSQVGEGTTFTVRLPAATPSPEPNALGKEPLPQSSPSA